MKLSINENNVEKIESEGHWGKPLVFKGNFNISSDFEVGVSEYQSRDFPVPKIHKDEEALYIICGKGIAKIGENKINIKKGTAIYIPPGIPHCIKNTGEDVLKAVYCHSGNKR